MAKSGAKRLLQENQARLAFLRNLLIASNSCFVVGRLLVFRSSTTWNTYLAAGVMLAIQLFCFTAVKRMAEPLLGAGGEILDGGADLLHASIASYYQDLIYLCAFVQVLSVITDKAFWAFWLIPVVGGWIIYTSIIKPFMAQRNSLSKDLASAVYIDAAEHEKDMMTHTLVSSNIISSCWPSFDVLLQETPETDAEKKRREKAERKASRPKFKQIR